MKKSDLQYNSWKKKKKNKEFNFFQICFLFDCSFQDFQDPPRPQGSSKTSRILQELQDPPRPPGSFKTSRILQELQDPPRPPGSSKTSRILQDLQDPPRPPGSFDTSMSPLPLSALLGHDGLRTTPGRRCPDVERIVPRCSGQMWTQN